jgi:hypothetical protein
LFIANVSKLLYSTVDPESFLNNLFAEIGHLRVARTKIRNHLREAFSKASNGAFGQEVKPRFFTQGSCGYKTVNDPAWPPRQQKDLDDGCYLPLSFMRGTRPSQAAALFFQFVDSALKELALAEGWKHEEKPSCSRLVISPDSHIDVPLYAIPDAEFLLLEDQVARRHTADAKISPDRWKALPSDAVLLAHREDDWVASDPRKIHSWFLEAVEHYGERLRRDCRYMKAWRDHHELDRDHLSSIVLMACVWTAYEEIRGPFLPDREDERLLRVVERLPSLLRRAVPNPACKDEDLNRMSEEERERVAARAEELRDRFRETVNACSDEEDAVDAMRSVLGDRIPGRPDLVVIAPAATVAAVMAHPRKVVAAPEVGRSKSG